MKSLYNLENKYAVIGTHGVGKTSIVSYLDFYFRQQSQIPEVIPEAARYAIKLGIPINEHTTLAAQQSMQDIQKANEMDATKRLYTNKINHIVCDRSILDNYVYALYRFDKDAKDKMYDNVMRWMSDYPYKHLFKMPLWNVFSVITNDTVRSCDKQFQIDIDYLLEDILSESGIEYYTIPTKLFNLSVDDQTTELRRYFDDKFKIIR